MLKNLKEYSRMFFNKFQQKFVEKTNFFKKKAKNLSHTLEHDVFFLITMCIGRFIRVSQLSYHSYLL